MVESYKDVVHINIIRLHGFKMAEMYKDVVHMNIFRLYGVTMYKDVLHCMRLKWLKYIKISYMDLDIMGLRKMVEMYEDLVYIIHEYN